MAGEGNVQNGELGSGNDTMPKLSFSGNPFEGTNFSDSWNELQKNKDQSSDASSEVKDPIAEALSKRLDDANGGVMPNPENEGSQEGSQQQGNLEGQESSPNDSKPENSDASSGSESEGISIESPLFGGKKKLGGESTENTDSSFVIPEIEGIDKVNSFLKDNFGVEDLPALSKKIEQYKSQEVDFTSQKQKIDQFNSFFENMDPDLYAAVAADAQGLDWKSSLNNVNVDLSKDVSKIDEKTLVDAFSPGKISEEDWKEYNDPEGDETVKRLVKSVIETSKSEFNRKKSDKQLSAQQEVEKQQKRQQAFSTSLVEAKKTLENEYSSIDPSALAQIEDVFTKSGIASVFYEQDGSLKSDAFVRLAMAKFGKDLVKQFEAIAMRKAETKVNQEMLERVPATPPEERGALASERSSGIRPEVQQMVDKIMSGSEKRHF